MSKSNLQANPYQPPIGVEDEGGAKNTSTVGVICFWIAVPCFAIGFVSFFIRNSPPLGWFLVALALLVAAIVFTRKRYRSVAIIGLILCVLASAVATITHYHRREAMRQQQRAMEAAYAADYERAMEAAYAADYERAMQSP